VPRVMTRRDFNERAAIGVKLKIILAGAVI
jgi:hypothetical protein